MARGQFTQRIFHFGDSDTGAHPSVDVVIVQNKIRTHPPPLLLGENEGLLPSDQLMRVQGLAVQWIINIPIEFACPPQPTLQWSLRAGAARKRVMNLSSSTKRIAWSRSCATMATRPSLGE